MVMQLERQKHNYLKNGAFLVPIKKSFEVKACPLAKNRFLVEVKLS